MACWRCLPCFVAAGRARHGGPAAEPTPSAVYGNAPALPPGAVTVHPYGTMRVSDSLDDYDDAPLSAIADPLEPWNRFWFHFNDIFFLYVAKPVYTAWSTSPPTSCAAG